jgi:hypothetical protein
MQPFAVVMRPDEPMPVLGRKRGRLCMSHLPVRRIDELAMQGLAREAYEHRCASCLQDMPSRSHRAGGVA